VRDLAPARYALHQRQDKIHIQRIILKTLTTMSF